MLLLDAGHLMGKVSLDEGGTVPFQFAAAAGGHELWGAVELVRDLLVAGGGGPVGGENLVRLATQQQGVHSPDVLGDEVTRLLVEVRRLPAAVLEAALDVLLRSARRLHDAIQGHKFADKEFAHVVTAP